MPTNTAIITTLSSGKDKNDTVYPISVSDAIYHDNTPLHLIIGNTDISGIGDGTLTGALSEINANGGSGTGSGSGGSSSLGTADISKIGDGTVKGAIKYLDENAVKVSTSGGSSTPSIPSTGGGSVDTSNLVTKTAYNKDKGTADISSIGDGTLTGAIKYLNENAVKVSTGGSSTGSIPGSSQSVSKTDYDNDMGTADISSIGDGTVKGSISSLFQSVSDGKKLVANAITDMGVTTSETATFATMADNIKKISSGSSSASISGTAFLVSSKIQVNSSNIVGGGTDMIAFNNLPKGTSVTISYIEWGAGQLSTDDYVSISGEENGKYDTSAGQYGKVDINYPTDNTQLSTLNPTVTTTGEGDRIVIVLRKLAQEDTESTDSSYVGIEYTLTLP